MFLPLGLKVDANGHSTMKTDGLLNRFYSHESIKSGILEAKYRNWRLMLHNHRSYEALFFFN